MFSVGQLVVYGGEGVCRVEYIGEATSAQVGHGQAYYHLRPLYRTGTVLTPVETRVLMREVISAAEARALIEELPALAPLELPQGNPRLAKDYYHQCVMRYDCREMAALIKAIAAKREAVLAAGRKVSQLDERYLKRAEDQLYGELAAVLGTERGQVAELIRRSWPGWPEKLPEPAAEA